MAVQIKGSQIKNGGVGSTQLADDAVSTAKVANAAINSAKIADDAIVSAKISDGAIDNADYLAANVVTSAKADKSGTWDFSSGVLRAATPSGASDVTTKSYVDSAVAADVFWKSPCRVASTGNINLASAPAAVDGITLANDDRVLCKDQSTASQSGIYVFAGTGNAMSRAADADSAADLNGAASFILEGSTHADQGFYQNAEITTLGSDAVTFVQFTGVGSFDVGDGLSKTGNRIDVDLSANSGLLFNSAELEVNDGDGLELASTALRVKLDGTTIARSANGIKVADGQITSTQLGAAAVVEAGLADNAVTSAKIEDNAITSAKIGASAVTEGKLGAAAVTNAKLGPNAVTAAKMNSSVAGDGLSIDASNMTINLDGTTLSKSASGLKVGDGQIGTSQIGADAVDKTKIAADVAGNGLAQNGDGSLELSLNAAGGLAISTDQLLIRTGDGIQIDGSNNVAAQANGSTINISASGIKVADNGVNTGQLANSAVDANKLANDAVTTAKIADDQVLFAKVGWRMFQEASQISGGSTSTIDLARSLDANAVNGVMVFKNGLAILNQTALGGSAANSDEFTVNATGGAGSVCRLTFGANLENADSIVIWYLT
jgi:hypothetical protein